MTLQDSYQMVIAAEIRAQKMYEALAKSFGKPETKAVFTELVLLEKNHETKVRATFAALFPTAKLNINVDAANDMKGINLSDPKDVLEFAIRREELAENIYKTIAEQTDNLEIKQLLLVFAHEEENHKTLLLAEIQRLHGALEWFDPSELNGLMEE